MQFAKESIFVSAVRSLCVSFAAIIGLVVGVLLILLAIGMFAAPDFYPKPSELTILPDAEGNRDLLPHSAPIVLRIDVQGVIGMGDLTRSKFENMLLDSRDGMFAHDRVKAILLYIDSPGGTVTDSDGMYRALMEYKKKYNIPIYAFVDGMCASGGMFIACSADKIFSTTSSVVGSVGVIIGPAFNVSQLMDRYGVQAKTITAGKDKDMLSPFRPWKEGEDASLHAITCEMYDEFVTIVTSARPQMDRTKLINEYGAQVYSGLDAQRMGYIDVGDGNYNMALEELAKAAQLHDEKEYQVVQIAPPKPFFGNLASEKFSLLSGKITHVLKLGPYMDSELSGRFLYMYQPMETR